MRLQELPVSGVSALPIRGMLGRSPGRCRPIRQGPSGSTAAYMVERLEQTWRTGALVPRRKKLSGVLLPAFCEIQRTAGQDLFERKCMYFPGRIHFVRTDRQLWL